MKDDRELGHDWWFDAPCRGRSALFYADDRQSQSIALAICARCPVVPQCEHETRQLEGSTGRRYGVRAGLTAENRRAWNSPADPADSRLTPDLPMTLDEP